VARVLCWPPLARPDTEYMAWRAKDATILLIDVGRSMQACADLSKDAKISKVDMAMGVARAFVQQKLIFLPKHEVGVVFYGTQETNNALQCDGYQNVSMVAEGTIDSPTLDLLRALLIAPKGGEDSDVINGLIVAIDLMIKRTNNLKFNKNIYLFTDGAGVDPLDPDLHECLKELASTGSKLQVTLVGSSDWSSWAAISKRAPEVELVPITTVARSSSLCTKPVEQRAKVRLPLVISPDLEIPVGVYSKTTYVRFPTLKKRSKLAAAVPAEHLKTESVTMERTYHVADDPDGEEVKPEDRIKGHKYGSSIVPMSEYDEAALMYSSERTLTTLGFALASSIGPEHSVSHTDAVAADKGDRWAYCALESLVSAMLAEDRVLIARYCFRKNAQPKMVALTPNRPLAGEASTLTIQYLPFNEDIRDWPFASLPARTAEQQKVTSSLADAMDLDLTAASSAGVGLAGLDLFRPEQSYNPCLRRFYTFLTDRALHPNAKLPLASAELLASIGVPPSVQERLATSQVADKLTAQFGLQKIEKHTKKTRKFWREAIADKRKEMNFEEVDVKRIKVDGGIGRKKEEKDEKAFKDECDKVKYEAHLRDDAAAGPDMMMAQPVGLPPKVHIGSVHPERDFEKWLANRVGGVDTVGPAIEQMMAMIERFADEGDDFWDKALSCLAVLRRGCVREGEAIIFNDFLSRMRGSFASGRQRLWKKAREAPIGLITDVEVPTSTVTAEEARAFLAGEEAHYSSRSSASAHGVAAPLSDKDLEDLIE